MIISIISTRYHLGQSVTCISLAAILSQLHGRSLLIDTQMYKDSQIDDYLSHNRLNHGLDDYIQSYKINDIEEFSHYTNSVIKDFDFVATNNISKLECEHMLSILENGSNIYDNIIIDVNQKHEQADCILEASDMVILMMDQNKKTVDKSVNKFKKYNDKMLYLVSQHNENIKYNSDVIAKSLKIEKEDIFSISYNTQVADAINNDTIVALATTPKRKNVYHQELYKIGMNLLKRQGIKGSLKKKGRK